MVDDDTNQGKTPPIEKNADKKVTAKESPPAEPVVDIDVSPGIPKVFDAPDLLKPPVRRAAYSDRTAWLMASLSDLAYFQFEGSQAGLASLIADIQGLVSGGEPSDRGDDIARLVSGFLNIQQMTDDEAKEKLREALNFAGLALDNIYNVAGTQAFLAHLDPKDGAPGMRILVFRGTEKNVKDIWTDLDAVLVPAIGAIGGEKVHRGFQHAYDVVRREIEADLHKRPDLPLYITGHSLGGALAIVATWFTAANSLGACYTFGGPRVGSIEFGERFKTPIYRVVNASDYVPRVPPSWFVDLFRGLCHLLPVPGSDFVVRFLDRFSGYIHFGDMRYLRHSNPGPKGDFPDMKVISNPSLAIRGGWVVRRWLSTWGKGGVDDHAIGLYRRKLRAYAIRRN